ncbi:hypothetical protein [Methylomonas rivi]|uniref:CopG family transcriptional regulator n=1 Tax=Methylomonas rivi TaxID=2952226 RepID=A0ABT1U3C0_9GAMM|nr:hypothetical protein [Methylomonas sp. WSC-6]MCQ8128307.1 hypothetical protein [Methylomonas sp. WSC-6]
MIELPAPIENRLIHAAQDAGQNLAVFLNRLLDEYAEDQADAKLAESAYKEFIESGESSISLDKLMTDNGL